jgi:hypothetical protein
MAARRARMITWQKTTGRNTSFGTLGPNEPTCLNNDFKLSYSGHWAKNRKWYLIDTRGVDNHHHGTVVCRCDKRTAKKVARAIEETGSVDEALRRVLPKQRRALA